MGIWWSREDSEFCYLPVAYSLVHVHQYPQEPILLPSSLSYLIADTMRTNSRRQHMGHTTHVRPCRERLTLPHRLTADLIMMSRGHPTRSTATFHMRCWCVQLLGSTGTRQVDGTGEQGARVTEKTRGELCLYLQHSTTLSWYPTRGNKL